MEVSLDQQKTTEPVPSKKGGLKTMPFIIVNETFEKVASFGLLANMMLFLKGEYNLEVATAASILFLWSAISHFMPMLGAVLSDSYLGRFRVIALASISSLLGMILLWLIAMIPQAKPPPCNPSVEICEAPTSTQLAILFASFGLMSIGAGGIRPCSMAFGADQLNKSDNPKNERVLQSFFNWYYASVGVSLMLAVTFIVYIQDSKGWRVGFGVPAILMFLSVVLFLLGSSLYVKVKANKSLFPGFAQVTVVAFKNRNFSLPPKNSDGGYYHKKDENPVAPSDKLRFLNKACIIRNVEKDLNSDGSISERWKVCTVEQVEELKALIKVIPIWSTGIIIAAIINQQFPVIQASVMDRHITSHFQIPAGSFSLFGILTLTIWVVIYDRIFVPILAKLTGQPRGLTFKQRMGIGLLLSCLSTAVAAEVERIRRRTAIQQGLSEHSDAIVNMTAMWLVPQHCLNGLAEAFNAIGQIEFFYSQFPKSMSSIAVALVALGMAVGNFVGSLIIGIVNDATTRKGKQSWVSSNLNKGHYDYYYWLLTFLSLVNFLYFLACCKAYGSCEEREIRVWHDGDDEKTKQGFSRSKDSSIVLSV